MIRKKWMLLLVCGLFILTAGGATAWAEGNVNLLFGQKKLDSDDWDPVDEPTEFGLMMDFKGANWPVSLAIDFLVANDEESNSSRKLESDTREINIGLRKYLPVVETLSLYLGGGLAAIDAEASASFGMSGASAQDSGIGFWFGGGMVITASDLINLGIDIRLSKAEVTLNDVEGEAGGTHLLAFVGFRF